MTPLLCVHNDSSSGKFLSDIMVGCDGSGEYFSESGESVTVTGTPEPGSVNTSGSDYDSSLWNQSITDTCEEHVYLGQPELDVDRVPDSTATDATLHISAQPSSTRNITFESGHPYANNFEDTWKISQPGAEQIRLHFDKLDLANYDYLEIYNDVGKRLGSYGRSQNGEDFWTEWYATDTLLVKLVTDSRYTSYGFLIDKVDCRYEKFPPTEHFAESYHPYANNYVHTWKISMPGANKTRLHFDKLSLAGSFSHYDTLRIYDELGRELVYYKGPTDNTDFWTEWQTTDTLRVKLVTDGQYTSYGFLIDLIETEEGVFTPSQIPAPANLTLHPGWNFISVPRPGSGGGARLRLPCAQPL